MLKLRSQNASLGLDRAQTSPRHRQHYLWILGALSVLTIPFENEYSVFGISLAKFVIGLLFSPLYSRDLVSGSQSGGTECLCGWHCSWLGVQFAKPFTPIPIGNSYTAYCRCLFFPHWWQP